MALRVSLIFTVLNEAASLPTLLDSIVAQRRSPDEIIVVDGGSRDETVAILDRYRQRLPLEVVVAPGANISAGRNVAIGRARGEIIAVTDGGVRLDPAWLERLVAPFSQDSPPDLVGGFFLPDPHSLFEQALAVTTLPAREEMGRGRFLPSSRSVAFTKAVWARVGGYPEWLRYSEDVLFDLAVQASGALVAYAPDAVVYFRPRGSLLAFARQYRNYAYGDGQALLWPRRHAIRYATYLVALPMVLALLRRPVPPSMSRSRRVSDPVSPGPAGAGRGSGTRGEQTRKASGGVSRAAIAVTLLMGGGAAMFFTPLKRLARLPLPWRYKLAAALLIPLIRVTGDLAKMVGFPQGLPEGFANRERTRAYLGNGGRPGDSSEGPRLLE
ncbi:MAG TPA: glycosyltransferase [Ardenticatenaceae bacterium]|nr:glycosyltransferase [Ardenticatenaceae bacterium]